MVIFLPLTVTTREAALAMVSVVMMPLRCGMPVIRLQIGLCRRQAGLDAFHRQQFENDTGREWQYLIGRDAENGTDRFAGFLRRLTPRLTGTGIGDTGIDHQRANFLAAGQVVADTTGQARRKNGSA